MDENIIIYQPKNGKPVRIFRPWEIRALIRAIPKNEYKDPDSFVSDHPSHIGGMQERNG